MERNGEQVQRESVGYEPFIAGAMAEQSGFSFDLCKRNAMLQSTGMKLPKFTKTGTTIVGVVYKVRIFHLSEGRFQL